MPTSESYQPAPVICREISVVDTLSLRHSVLWPNEPLSKVQLPEDDRGYHFGAFELERHDADGAVPAPVPVAVISLFRESFPSASREPGLIDSDQEARAVRFRKFACEPARQGRGVGTALLAETFRFAREELDVSVVWCDARESKREWYERRGMVVFGETFFKGPVEYVRMRVDLAVG